MKSQDNAASRLCLPAWLLFSALLSVHLSAWAKTADNDSPVHIEADQMEMREKDDISIYTGDVRITKGSIKITGDRVVIQNKNGVLYNIKIDGRPATFYQLNDLGETITAQSHKMDYKAENGTLELKTKAVLEKNKNRFSSEHIIYDTLNDIVKAGTEQPVGSQNGSQPPPRVKITIHPEKKSATDAMPPRS
ncbi:hypothetical protein MNBD_GAMMA11-2358 [hydrothermal vent metagenome]|uniref:Organic solvent tolerance-like N-terminal domain-containing protein n=1 Tax=hydrothermal vent metagenome TaxID=652676 RepID=A0A3B0XL50_9ZZZZ